MAPTGIKVLPREFLEDFGSWSPHALFGWYIGPSLEYYCCRQIWIPDTTSVCIGQTISWFNHKLITSTDTATYIIMVTAKYLTAALEKMESSFKGALRVMVSDSSSREFLLVCFNAAVKYLAVTIIM